MEKGADAVDAVCANLFTGVLFFVCFFHPFFKVVCLFLCSFWHFCSLLNGFEHFLHIFCVLISQAPRCARALLYVFSISVRITAIFEIFMFVSIMAIFIQHCRNQCCIWETENSSVLSPLHHCFQQLCMKKAMIDQISFGQQLVLFWHILARPSELIDWDAR